MVPRFWLGRFRSQDFDSSNTTKSKFVFPNFDNLSIIIFHFFQIKSTSDTSNFDSYPREEDVPPDEFSGWDKDF